MNRRDETARDTLSFGAIQGSPPETNRSYVTVGLEDGPTTDSSTPGPTDAPKERY
ncbi:hypothetical protein GS429_13785 [Natronorubrum sp. JWXQ-INN-674]|uniref:Uncharacterized protein n=1 Tax=Natronorubrum halalkaliphilum TaxID=2691917 RepID=A0A6B0VRJ4_9EURY|nr:hypothetical protein [Natronorubrum halalkaliphilum]MXV63119.1 hypothetical protein [Natronorubrum halalkaliphilum]